MSLLQYGLLEFIVYNYPFRALRFRQLKKRYPHEKLPFAPQSIINGLENRGFRVNICSKSLDDFPNQLRSVKPPWLYRLNTRLSTLNTSDFKEQKLFQIYSAAEQIISKTHPVVMDVGASYFKMKHFFPGFEGTFYRLDKKFKPGIHGDKIGANAAKIPLESDSLDFISLLSAFEHFEGNSDKLALTEFMRVLRPGGILHIVPLYLANQEYAIV